MYQFCIKVNIWQQTLFQKLKSKNKKQYKIIHNKSIKFVKTHYATGVFE